MPKKSNDDTPRINEGIVAELPVGAGNKIFFFKGAMVQGSTVPRGFGVRVTPAGSKTFVLCYYRNDQQRRAVIGRHPDWSVVAAVRRARELRQQIDRGEDPAGRREPAKAATATVAAPDSVTVNEVLDRFVAQHVERSLRRPEHYVSTFDRLVRPALGSMPVYSLRRSHIATMLDVIDENNGPVMADRALSYFGTALNWHATRDDDFTPPKLAGLKRANTREHERDRILADDEIRRLWTATANAGLFGDVVRFLLLTGQRKGDAYGMTWEELEGDVWTIPGARYKTHREHTVPLSKAALAIVEAQLRTGKLIFAGKGGRPMTTSNKRKDMLDATITPPLADWTVHDLRRTARSLMGRAGVRPDIAERVVGHAVGNKMNQIYDRHTYGPEMRDAVERLAALIERITNPPAENVVPIRAV